MTREEERAVHEAGAVSPMERRKAISDMYEERARRCNEAMALMIRDCDFEPRPARLSALKEGSDAEG